MDATAGAVGRRTKVIICTRGWSADHQYSGNVMFNTDNVLYAQDIADGVSIVCFKHNVVDARGIEKPERIMCDVSVQELMVMVK